MTKVTPTLVAIGAMGILLLAFSSRAISTKHTNGEAALLGLKFLGTVGSKSYFADGDLWTDWEGGLAHCNAAGLKLASVENIDEADFLSGKLFTEYGRGWFRSSGRELRAPQAFVWDSTQPKPENFRGPQGWSQYNSGPFHYCVVIGADNATGLRGYTEHCSTSKPVLCQT